MVAIAGPTVQSKMYPICNVSNLQCIRFSKCPSPRKLRKEEKLREHRYG
jgi:hypothetical protein